MLLLMALDKRADQRVHLNMHHLPEEEGALPQAIQQTGASPSA